MEAWGNTTTDAQPSPPRGARALLAAIVFKKSHGSEIFKADRLCGVVSQLCTFLIHDFGLERERRRGGGAVLSTHITMEEELSSEIVVRDAQAYRVLFARVRGYPSWPVRILYDRMVYIGLREDEGQELLCTRRNCGFSRAVPLLCFFSIMSPFIPLSSSSAALRTRLAAGV